MRNMGSQNNDTTNRINEGAGLYNLGNTCYMNSLLQCLKNVFPLTQIIFSFNFNYGSLILEYKRLLCNMISSKNDITDALDYYNALGKIDSYYACHEQRDSSKLFLTHIKALIEDTKNYPSKADIDLTIEKEEPKLIKRYNKSKERNPSFLYDYFYGFLKTVNECYNCKHKEVIYQPYSLISLNLTTDEGEPIKDLYGLIKNYEEKKKSLMQCTCGNYYIEQTIFGRIPPILVFKFERSVNGYHFDYQIDYDSVLYMKEYSDGFLDQRYNKKNHNLKFNLVGVMLHTGNAYGGHKTSFTKNFINKTWYYFNDEKKDIVGENEVLNAKEAFMLFYISESFQISESKIQSIINKAEEKSEKCEYHKGNYHYNYNYPIQNSYYSDNKLNQKNEIYNSEIYNINNSKYNINKINSINDIYNKNNNNYNANNVDQMNGINSRVESNNIIKYYNNINQGNIFNNKITIDDNNIINNSSDANLINAFNNKVLLNNNNIQYNNTVGYQIIYNKHTLNNNTNPEENNFNLIKEYSNKVNNNGNNGNDYKNQTIGKKNSNKEIPKSNNINKKNSDKTKNAQNKNRNKVNKHSHH